MEWKRAIKAWQALTPQQKLERRWARIPGQVARSMAFEGEPVNQQKLEAEHARRPMPRATSTPRLGG